MAARKTAHKRQPRKESKYGQVYVYGNVVRQPNGPSERNYPKRRASRQVRKNRKRAMDMNPVYAGFLVVSAICIVVVCVIYLQIQSEIVQRAEHITSLQEELADLKEENDTAYSAIEGSVNLQEIRAKAMNDLGMVYAADGHVIEYESPTSDYLKQYEEIPEDGVLTKSKNVSK